MPQIKLVKPDIAFTCADDDTILRAAQRAGLGFPYECNVGSCGNCLFELVEGEVEHNRKDAPAWQERAPSAQALLGCQARPLGDCLIKINLRDRYKRPAPAQAHASAPNRTEDVTHDIREFRFRLAQPAPFLRRPIRAAVHSGRGGRASLFDVQPGEDGDGVAFPDQARAGRRRDAAAVRRGSRSAIADRLDGPYGMAYLREDAPRDMVCIAGGSGLSPMISIARAFAAKRRRSASGRLHFVYGGRRARDICGEPILATAARLRRAHPLSSGDLGGSRRPDGGLDRPSSVSCTRSQASFTASGWRIMRGLLRRPAGDGRCGAENAARAEGAAGAGAFRQFY